MLFMICEQYKDSNIIQGLSNAWFWKIWSESKQGTHPNNLQSPSFHLCARNKGHYLRDILWTKI